MIFREEKMLETEPNKKVVSISIEEYKELLDQALEEGISDYSCALFYQKACYIIGYSHSGENGKFVYSIIDYMNLDNPFLLSTKEEFTKKLDSFIPAGNDIIVITEMLSKKDINDLHSVYLNSNPLFQDHFISRNSDEYKKNMIDYDFRYSANYHVAFVLLVILVCMAAFFTIIIMVTGEGTVSVIVGLLSLLASLIACIFCYRIYKNINVLLKDGDLVYQSFDDEKKYSISDIARIQHLTYKRFLFKKKPRYQLIMNDGMKLTLKDEFIFDKLEVFKDYSIYEIVAYIKESLMVDIEELPPKNGYLFEIFLLIVIVILYLFGMSS